MVWLLLFWGRTGLFDVQWFSFLISFECLYIVVELYAQGGEFFEYSWKVKIGKEEFRYLRVKFSLEVHDLGFVIKGEICMQVEGFGKILDKWPVSLVKFHKLCLSFGSGVWVAER